MAPWCSAIVDISARKRLEERFRQVVELAPNAIVMIGSTGLIEMVNAQTERVFGYSRDELLGKPVEMLVPERYRPNHPGLRTSFFANPVSRPMGAGRDLYGLRKDGSEFPVEIGLNPIATEDGTLVLSAIVDISARKQLEDQVHAMDSMLTHMNRVATAGELLSSIAHEINSRSRRWSFVPTRDYVGLRGIRPISTKRERPLEPLSVRVTVLLR